MAVPPADGRTLYADLLDARPRAPDLVLDILLVVQQLAGRMYSSAMAVLLNGFPLPVATLISIRGCPGLVPRAVTGQVQRRLAVRGELGRGVEGLVGGLHEAVVVDQGAELADEEALTLGDFQVEDRTDRVVRHPANRNRPAERADGVAGLEIAGHHPPLTRLPEAVDSGGDDGLVAELDPEGRRGLVVVDGQDRHEVQAPVVVS